MPNKHIDLFKEIIPSVDLGLRDLWDAVSDDARKEIKVDFWNLTRYISSIRGNNQEASEHFVLAVNEFYNKNWKDLQNHPKLLWQLLCLCGREYNKTFSHEWIKLERKAQQGGKKMRFLQTIYPAYKLDDLALLASMYTDKDIKQLAKDHGWDDKQIKDL